MTCYSHSRISTFEQCRYKYKLQYIDKIKVATPTTIEAFMGTLVHKVLEKLYTDLKFQKLNTLKKLLKFYSDNWEKEYTPEILIVKSNYTAGNYKQMGEKYIANYYHHYKPFNEMSIIGLETDERITLPDGNKYHIRIDKLGFKGNIYYVCDYKTSIRMKKQEDADSDRQLAMYSIWVKNKFPDAEKIMLKWHMLSFDKEILSERTGEELEKLQKETVTLIKEMEKCKEFPISVTGLCNYCVFQSLCLPFKHEAEIEKKSPEKFKDDDGVRLVDEYSELDKIKKETAKKIEKIKVKLIKFAQQKDLNRVCGSNKEATLKEYLKVVYPEEKEAFVKLLKKKGLYDEFSSVNYLKLSPKILKNEIDKSIIKLTKTEKDCRVSLSKRKEEDT